MKIPRSIGFIILFTTLVSAATQTITTTELGSPTTAQTDQYGDSYIEQEVKISTKNFKVDNFWNSFFDAKNAGESHYNSISRTGLFRIITSSTSACALDRTLPEEGCSGQKPFLLNDEVFLHPMTGTTNRYSVAFNVAANYNSADPYAFYPLDINRDGQYYKAQSSSASNSGAGRGFFGFFTSAFDYLFSKTIGFGNDFFGNPDIANTTGETLDPAAQDRRQRYIANIMAGVDQKHRMSMPINGANATPVNAGIRLNDPVSLLHYDKSIQMNTTNKCQFMFTSLSSDGIMCRVMSGFGMDAWMPFFNKGKINKIKANTITIDTEDSLLAMAGKITNVPYMKDVGGDDNSKLTFLQKILKPMANMFNYMKIMLFGTSKASIAPKPVERDYNFTNDTAMTLAFAITNDGTQVDKIQNFRLHKIRSIYGDMLDSCRVKKTAGMFSWSHWDETFYIGGNISKKGPDGDVWNSDQWVDWCQKATGQKGMFDYLLDWKSGAFFNPFNLDLRKIPFFGHFVVDLV